MRGGFWRYFDFWLLGAVTILVIIGITMIRSALAGNIELTVTTPLVSRQIIFALIGFALLLAAAGVDYRVWSSMSSTLYVGIIIVLVALNVIGAALFGSARWFRTTLVFIQPSEFAKLVLILSISHFFVLHMHEMDNPKWTIRSLLLAMGITIWVILQPNLSTSIVLLVLWFVLLWMSNVPIKQLLGYALGGILAIGITFPVLLDLNVIQDYQLKRILNFIAPDPNARYGDIYNIQQALISIGSGGWFGQGYGHGTPEIGRAHV
jgi:rod shape determining protein RodA